jgi:deoxyribodipyrimidine photo-lyase
MSYRVVWFKRDLRLHDHAALHHAASQGPVLALYVMEPQLWQQADMALQHHNFIRESLRDLYREARGLGLTLNVVSGDIVEVLQQLHAQAPFLELVSHEETGNAWTYARDLRVAAWCRAHNMPWTELPQFGVVRRLRSRDTWHSRWQAHMTTPCLPVPPLVNQPLPWSLAPLPDGTAYGLTPHDPPQRQRGGRQLGRSVLQEFLNHRSRSYRGGISSPLSAPTACSRLSPYLSYGCLSLREVVQATEARLQSLDPDAAHHRRGLAAFVSRLHWHCHFIQKLETEPEIEWRNMHRGYDDLREPDWNPEHFETLTQGRTGWPLVDACVAMLHETGWLNFRMRAMLVSVASYPLWLHWRPVGEWLARQFLDYEPGIHWSQMQMQAGTTGINTTRVYNPIKQARDHDPQGRFVRHWLPAMRQVPDSWLFEPWHLTPAQRASLNLPPEALPTPPVALEPATREAKSRLHTRRAQPQVKAAKADVVLKHGSRLVQPARARRTPKASNNGQAELGF